MPSCCVIQCGARKTKNQPLLTLHRLPVNEILKKKWIEIIGQEKMNLRHKTLFVCSMHFEEKWFNRTLDITRLRDGAVPSSSLWPNLIQSFPQNEQQNPEIRNAKDTTSPSTTPLKTMNEQNQNKAISRSQPTFSAMPNDIQIYLEYEEQNPETNRQDTTSPSTTPNHIQICSENEQENPEDNISTSPSPTPLQAKYKQNQIKTISRSRYTVSAMIRNQNKKIRDLMKMCSSLKSKVKSLNQVVRRRNKKIAHYSKVIEDLIKIKKNNNDEMT